LVVKRVAFYLSADAAFRWRYLGSNEQDSPDLTLTGNFVTINAGPGFLF